jgi:hypothetical protein
VFAAELVAILLLDLTFRKRSSSGGDFSGLDFGDNDEGGCGD